MARPSSISVECIFAEGSLALGCHLLIQDVAINQSVSRNATRSLLDNADAHGSSLLAPIAQYHESGLRSGQYIVLVFDLEEDGSVNASRWLYKQEIEVPQPSPVLSSASIFNIASGN